MHRKLGIATAIALLTIGCSGGDDGKVDPGAPDAGNNNPLPDAGNNVPRDGGGPPADAGPRPDAGMRDAGMPVVAVDVSGQVAKLGAYYGGNNDYVANASVLTYGIAPPQTVQTGGNGEYTLTLPANGQVAIAVSRLGYNQTYNAITTAEAPIIDRRIYIAEAAWLSEIAGAHGVDLTTPFACQTAGLVGNQCLYAAVVGQLLDDGTAGNGTVRPVGGVQQDDFSIYGPNNADWYVRGPYFLDYTGTSSAAAQGSVVYQNGAGEYLGGYYIFFPEVPIGGAGQVGLQVSVTYDYNGANRYFGPHTLIAFRAPGAAVTRGNIYETGLEPPDVPPVDIDFDTQVYPMFLTVEQGGLGCIGCHTDQGGATPAGGMNLYGGPDVAFGALDPAMYPQRVNLATPAASYLLVRPLYEADGNQDHPIFAFASPDDPGYKRVLTWITEGGKRDVVVPPVSFYNEVRELLYQPSAQGGAGCYTCHVNGVDETNAPGGFYMGGDGNALHDALTNVAPTDPGPYDEAYRINKDPQYPDRSIVLTKPLTGNIAAHPVKIFSDNQDPRYLLIYRWIVEGYINDTP